MFVADLPPAPAVGDSIVRVTPRDLRDLRLALARTQDIWSHAMRNGEIDLRLSRDAIESLARSGVPIEILIDDVDAMIASQAAERAARRAAGAEGGIAGDDWWADVKDLAQVHAKLDEWIADHPELVSPVLLGTSLEGRPIRGVRISSQPVGADLPAFLFNACQHAREWATPMTAMLIGQELIDGAGGDPRIQTILSQCEVIIVPVVNPDGYHFSWVDTRLWRKNRRDNGDGTFGVDLNRNWGYEWGGQGSSGNPNSETYRGTAPFSEPETQAMRDFILGHGRVVGNIDFHSYSQLILWPWGWTQELSIDQPLFVELGAAMQAAIDSVHGRFYEPGPIYTTIYPAAGGSVDWCYGGAGVFATTVEVRDTGAYGFLIPAAEVRPCAEENTAAALSLIETLLVPAFMAADPEFPTLVPADTPAPVSIYAVPLADAFDGTPTLRARVGTSADFESIPMSALGDDRYEAMLPSAPCGAVIEFYFEWNGDSLTARLPGAAPAELFGAGTTELSQVHGDSMETDLGWTVGAAGDNATSGQWVRVDPNGTTAQPEDDHTPGGTICWVTGQGVPGGAAGAADVDNGITTLVSPLLDGGDPNSVLRYWRWYSNNQGAAPNSDSMLVEVSTDGATWTLIEEVSTSANAWIEASFAMGDIVSPPGPFRVRFVARDLNAGSLVEAAIDDLSIEGPSCAVNAADFNQDGVVDGDDLGTLLGQWGKCVGCPADLNGDGVVDGDDLGALLGEWS
ncbi:MAG: hypothetical protein FJ253_08680 [Phycisphaerae bacterium]|nr:hypothetical protein [Phycisphaerae bacterium]